MHSKLLSASLFVSMALATQAPQQTEAANDTNAQGTDAPSSPFSTLPHELQHLILSFVPECTAATSQVCSNWQHLNTSYFTKEHRERITQHLVASLLGVGSDNLINAVNQEWNMLTAFTQDPEYREMIATEIAKILMIYHARDATVMLDDPVFPVEVAAAIVVEHRGANGNLAEVGHRLCRIYEFYYEGDVTSPRYLYAVELVTRVCNKLGIMEKELEGIKIFDDWGRFMNSASEMSRNCH